MWSGPATGLWSVATCDQCKVPFVVYIVVFSKFQKNCLSLLQIASVIKIASVK